MASEAPRSGGAADSYIGSLISLTSKFEIRYEGILYNISTEESTIGLKNVRSFGTEGRKRDGPQIPPSDKVYEYILFRGSDIKDLQVKSSLPAQAAPAHNDPAIIQSHYSQSSHVPTSAPHTETGAVSDPNSYGAPGLPGNSLLQTSQPSMQPPPPPPASAPTAGNDTVPDLTSNTAPSLLRSTFQGGLPLYQSGLNMGSWSSSPGMPNANSTGVAVPPGYWQGYYVPSSGLPPHLQQFRPQPGLPIPHPLQQSLHYSAMNSGLPTNSPYLPEFSSSLLPPISLPSTTGITFPGLPPSNLTFPGLPPSNLPSTLGPSQASAPASETSSMAATNQALSTSLASNTPSNVPTMPTLAGSSIDAKNVTIPNSNKSQALLGPTFPSKALAPAGAASTVHSPPTRTETLVAPTLITPGQLLQPGPTTLSSSQASPREKKSEENLPLAFSEGVLEASDNRAPILPLPTPSHSKVNGTAPPMRGGYRGWERGRGYGISRAGTKFTEDFDFMAMNEKFNKDEVWGELGKSKDVDADDDDAELEYSKREAKPVYVKDDFFDTLSCNSLGHEHHHGRTKFSEQMKLDTETFGSFPRHRGGRGGRGPPRGGRGRGSYYGRGYNYGGRGRN